MQITTSFVHPLEEDFSGAASRQEGSQLQPLPALPEEPFEALFMADLLPNMTSDFDWFQ